MWFLHPLGQITHRLRPFLSSAAAGRCCDEANALRILLPKGKNYCLELQSKLIVCSVRHS